MSFVLNDAGAAERVLSQMKRIARALYSNPPVHGARIVSEVVGSEEMLGEWKGEMEAMAGRIKVRGGVSCEAATASRGCCRASGAAAPGPRVVGGRPLLC
jgi:aspartate/tyrosine/aromatic aminotransferase